MLKLRYVYKVPINRKTPEITEDSSVGARIKFYRIRANISQMELAKRLNVSSDVIKSIENVDRKIYDVDILNNLVDVLGIRKELIKYDTYVSFLLNNPSEQITKYRIKHNLTKKQLANKMNVNYKTVLSWERGRFVMSKTNYDILRQK